MKASETKKRKSDITNGSPEVAVQEDSLKIPSLLDIRWNKQYQQLIQVFQMNGPCEIPLSFVVKTEDGQVLKLGSWLGTQRRLYRKNMLSAHKKQQLQELVAKGWISLGSTESKASHDDANWNLKYEQLLEYGKKHGDYNIPTRRTFVPGETSDNEAEGSDEGEESEEHSAPSGEVASIRLGKWLERQRHGMRTNTLKADRLEKLQKLVDAGLLVVDSVAEGELSWQQHFAALMEYAQTYQHCNVPYGYEVKVEVSTPMKLDASSSSNGQVETAGQLEREENNENQSSRKTEVLYLGHWLSNQRHAHNRTNRCLRADRVAQLQALVDRGLLKWRCEQLTREQKWNEMYEWLLKYCEDHAWMAAGTSSAASVSHTIPSVPEHAPTVFTPPTSAGASTLIGTSVSTDERTSAVDSGLARRLVPFSGSAELSDGSSVSLFSWLQRQLSAMSEIDMESDQSAPRGSSASALAELGQCPAAQMEEKIEGKHTREAVKKKLSPECARKIKDLLSKGEGIFQWQS